jgi:hypothetical protein
MTEIPTPKKSWRTTACGVLALVASAIPMAIAFIDGDPNTTVGMEQLSALGMGIAAAFGLTLARDNKVTSEQAGAKPPTDF